jgi:hypothetical protein
MVFDPPLRSGLHEAPLELVDGLQRCGREHVQAVFGVQRPDRSGSEPTQERLAQTRCVGGKPCSHGLVENEWMCTGALCDTQIVTVDKHRQPHCLTEQISERIHHRLSTLRQWLQGDVRIPDLPSSDSETELSGARVTLKPTGSREAAQEVMSTGLRNAQLVRNISQSQSPSRGSSESEYAQRPLDRAAPCSRLRVSGFGVSARLFHIPNLQRRERRSLICSTEGVLC